MKNNISFSCGLPVDEARKSVIDELKNDKGQLQESPQAFDDRTVRIHLNNQTNETLTLVGAQVSLGVWLTHPSSSIAPYTTDTFESGSETWLMGTTGETVYRNDESGLINLWWDNPYIGSNAYIGVASDGFTLSREGGDGNNAVLTWTVRKA